MLSKTLIMMNYTKSIKTILNDNYEIKDKWNSTPCGTSLYGSACGFGYGSLTADSNTNYHGNAVASIAAGGWDSNATNSMMGVAYKAGLHLTDYTQKTGDYYADHWADGTDNAKEKGMIVQNNSWGFTNTAYNSSTSYTSSSIALSVAHHFSIKKSKYFSALFPIRISGRGYGCRIRFQ